LDFPDRETFGHLLESMGFAAVRRHCMTPGIVCIHGATRPA